MSDGNARIHRYNILKKLLNSKMLEGTSITVHMIKMMNYANDLEKLYNAPFPKQMVTDIIFNSLPHSYSNFIMMYHMNGMEKSIEELCGLLRSYEFFMKEEGASDHLRKVNEGGKKIKKTKKKCKNYKGKGKRC